MSKHALLIGDCIERLQELPESSHQVCITSPPYWNLRDYNGEDKQIGLEESIEAHLDVLLRVFREVRRVLRPDATLWVNYGDKYEAKELLGLPWRLALALQEDDWCLRSDIIWSKPNPMPEGVRDRPTRAHEYLFMLSAGPHYFYDLDAVREKTGKESSWEQYEEYLNNCIGSQAGENQRRKDAEILGAAFGDKPGKSITHPSGRNLRDVWEIPIYGLKEAHFATYPPALVEPCIKAGSSEKGCCSKCGAPYRRIVEVSGGTIGTGGWHQQTKEESSIRGQAKTVSGMDTYSRETTGWEPGCGCDAGAPIPCKVLDPFGGALTTALVADRLGRDSTSIELSRDYAAIGASRLRAEAPLFLNLEVSE